MHKLLNHHTLPGHGLSGSANDEHGGFSHLTTCRARLVELLDSPILRGSGLTVSGLRMADNMAQLRSVLVMVLASVVGTRRNIAEHSSRPAMLEEGLCAEEAHLETVLADLLLSAPSPSRVCWRDRTQSQRCVTWETCLSSRFQGRLLPGCSRLGCLNLSGVSEAALPTLLCSGCRRARYCGVECQRAAWVDEGHRSVCGSAKLP